MFKIRELVIVIYKWCKNYKTPQIINFENVEYILGERVSINNLFLAWPRELLSQLFKQTIFYFYVFFFVT